MTQKQAILNHLLTGKTLTPLEALEKFGCFRLGARIWDLRHEGYDIKNIGSDDGQWAVYEMHVTEQTLCPNGHAVYECQNEGCPGVAAPVLPPAFKSKAADQPLFA